MRYYYKFLCLLTITLCHALETPKRFNVKVLLKDFKSNDADTFTLSSTHGILIDLYNEKNIKKSLYFKHSAPIKVCNSEVFLNNHKISNDKPIRINAFDGHIKYHHDDYCGTFYLIPHDGSILLVNKVDLEEYIYSVLRAESWPGWPLEVNKVFAVTCRSYVIKKVLESRKSKAPYHIKNTNIHQTYRGIRANNIHEQAVSETAGLFLGYNGEPIAAMFDSCCGGVVTAHINGPAAGVNFTKAPYLARKKQCNFCKRCKIFNWGFELPLKELERRCKHLLPENFEITNVTIGKTDKAGLVIDIILHGSNKEKVTLHWKKFYNLCREVKSSKFNITKKKHSIAVKGNGYGHHLGLCQWGAWQMVKDGWHYKRILHFYYPDTHLMKLEEKKEIKEEKDEPVCQTIKDTSEEV